MANDSSNFVVGVCTRTQGPSSFVEVRAQSIEGAITDISSSSHNLFGNNGEIEVRGVRPALKPGDWVLARPALEGPPKRKRYVAPSGRRLTPFEDLSGLYAPEAARRLLVETGRQDGFSGDKMFRIGASEMIEVRMAISADGRSRISLPQDLSSLPVWPYQPERHVRVPSEAGPLDLFAKDPGASQSGFVNWSSDADFLREVIRSLASEGSDNEPLKAAATLLSGHADELEKTISKAERLDARVGQEIMRSRRLADILKSRDDLLRDFLSVLRSDPEVKAQLAARTEELAAQAANARSEALVVERTASLEADLQDRRARGQTELEETLREIEATEFAAMTARLHTAREAALSDISEKKDELEQEVAALMSRRAETAAQIEADANRLGEAGERLAGLEKDLAARKDEIDRIIRMETLLQERGPGRTQGAMPRVPGFRSADLPARQIALGELASWVETCGVLSAGGKPQCVRALADLLAGGLPVLSGRDVDDFVTVLAAAVGGGRHVSFDCDPTIISFDDLWVRPGSGTPTVLGEALADCDDKKTVRVCVLRNVDRSAAHVWLETLADKLHRRRVVPDNMLVCLTLAAPPSEALAEALKRLPSVDTTGATEKAAVIAELARSPAERMERQIDMSTVEIASAAASAEAAGKLLLKDVPIGFADVDWFARLVTVASALLGKDSDEFVLAAARRRAAVQKGGSPSNGKPGLRVIESGGASNA